MTTELDRRIAFLESEVPAAAQHPEDPRDRRVIRDRWWRRQTRWAEAARAMVVLMIVYTGLNALGWRIVDRRDADLATTVVRLWPDAYRWKDAELRHRLEGRAAAVSSLEAILAVEPTKVGWISSLFGVTPSPQAIRRADVGKVLADRIAREPVAAVGAIVDRLFVLAHHLGETVTFEALEQLASLPRETKAALFNNAGDALIRIARTSGSHAQAALQLQVIERVIQEERTVLVRRRGHLEQQRGYLAVEATRIENEVARYVAARVALNACATAARRSIR
jgi:hypothetical protein